MFGLCLFKPFNVTFVSLATQAVMNLLSAVKTEEAEAEVKVQYWQDTILTR